MKGTRSLAKQGVTILSSMWLIASFAAAARAQGSRFAVRFFGTGTGQIDRIKIPIVSNMAMNVGEDFTIDFWIRAAYVNNAGVVYPGMNGDGWITGNVIFDRDVYGGGDYGDFGISIGRDGTNCVVAFGLHNGTTGETIVGTNNVGDFRWHHVAVTRAASDGLMQIFVDGVLDASAYGPTGNISYRVGRATAFPNSDPYIVLGAEKHDAGSEYPSFYGTLDELRIWNRALSAEELSSVRHVMTPPFAYTNLVGYWRFEEGTNQWIRDSAHGYTGTLYNGVFGNGEWRSWNSGTNFVAPINFYQPKLSALFHLTSGVMNASWFAQANVNYSLMERDEIKTTTGTWSFVTGATNLTGSDSNITVTVNYGNTSQRFYRLVGSPYR